MVAARDELEIVVRERNTIEEIAAIWHEVDFSREELTDDAEQSWKDRHDRLLKEFAERPEREVLVRMMKELLVDEESILTGLGRGDSTPEEIHRRLKAWFEKSDTSFQVDVQMLSEFAGRCGVTLKSRDVDLGEEWCSRIITAL